MDILPQGTSMLSITPTPQPKPSLGKMVQSPNALPQSLRTKMERQPRRQQRQQPTWMVFSATRNPRRLRTKTVPQPQLQPQRTKMARIHSQLPTPRPQHRMVQPQQPPTRHTMTRTETSLGRRLERSRPTPMVQAQQPQRTTM